jgi:tetratricopeptide (TPR) repeat protein
MSDAAAQLMQQADRARREARLADAHRDLIEAIALCRAGGGGRNLVQALKGLGQIERDMGHGSAALAPYEEAVGICRGLSDPLLLAHTVRHLGDVYQDSGRLDLAEPCYHEALALYRGDGQTHALDLANAIRPLAMLKEKNGELDEARRLWLEAGDLYAAVDVQAGVAESSARLGRLLQLGQDEG